LKVIKAHQKAEIVCEHVRYMVEHIDTKDLIDEENDKSKFEVDLYVYPFVNGREKGLMFTRLGDVFIYVSEHRNTDNIVVTASKAMDYSGVTEEEYEKRIFLGSEDFNEAASKVLEILKLPNNYR